MTINDFAPLIQLGASLAIAVVAVDSVKSYTKQIADKLYKFPDFVKSTFGDCFGKLPDAETLDHLEPVTLDGKSTLASIEKVKRNRETVCKHIQIAQSEKLERVNEICQAKSLSSLNLLLFIYNAFLLFLGGLEISYSINVHLFVVTYTVFVLLFMCIGWIVGECEHKKKILQFSSLRHSIFSSLALVFLSLIVFFILEGKNTPLNFWINSNWYFFLIIGMCLVYVNFIIFTIKVGRSASDFKEEVQNTKSSILPDCENVKKEVDDLIATNRVSSTLNAD